MLESNAVSTFTAVAPGRIAAVVTALEMRQPPADLVPPPPRPGWRLRHEAAASPAWYRELFRRVGEPWLWFSRLRLTESALTAILHDAAVEVYALQVEGRDQGLLELDRRQPGEIEISFFGVTPALIGSGAGAWLMRHGLALAWRHKPQRLWVHTCTFDHPRALDFYRRCGFRPTGRFVEVAEDPRLLGILSREAAPHVPLLEA